MYSPPLHIRVDMQSNKEFVMALTLMFNELPQRGHDGDDDASSSLFFTVFPTLLLSVSPSSLLQLLLLLLGRFYSPSRTE
jgi:hypothetical protein